MRAVDLIRHKRDGGTLDRAQIDFFIAGVTDGTWPDYQTAAMLMAIWLRGMSAQETADLTDAMVRSGARVSYPSVAGTPVDKHSTGGVGDKTSPILASLAAACGAHVPMMSGRALGHTGGTLDKLESIPGFRTALSVAELQRAVERLGCALIGQTSDVAPADRKLYALRDVTATVESIPLISASIMSKKIAEGIGGLVLDVKTGAGAFMREPAKARELAECLVSIGRTSGVTTEALITRMDAPLGRMVGNALEIVECIETLKGRGPEDVETLSVLLAARMLMVAGIEPDERAAEGRIRQALASGAGVEKFREIVSNQGGDPRVLDDYALLPSAPDREPVRAPRAGYVTAIHAGDVGQASVSLGAGRGYLGQDVDYGVGVQVAAPPGTRVREGEPILIVHHRAAHGLAEAMPLLQRAVVIGDEPPPSLPLVLDRIS